MEKTREWRSFGGWQRVYRHDSETLGCSMELAVYLPPRAESEPVPLVTWLSGLTCTWENFTSKAGAQAHAARLGLALVAPDTSPRGLDLPGEHDRFDLGSGAGFYVDATEPPWSRHYRMWSYVTEEVPELLRREKLPLDLSRQGICGHSMGGHGALVAALRLPDRYHSLSALAPIGAPSRVPWGKRAFTSYLGEDRERWRAYDACALVEGSGWRSPVLVDQGTADEFLHEQLRPDLLREAFAAAGVPLTLRLQEGYDHSYYFVASFVGDHLEHHARLLGAMPRR